MSNKMGSGKKAPTSANRHSDPKQSGQRVADARLGYDKTVHVDLENHVGVNANQLQNPLVYNPLDRRNLGRSVADALLQSDLLPLRDVPKFRGAGIYALYYTGAHPAYVEIAKRNRGGLFLLPIYVGRAVPAGARKGHIGEGIDPGKVLSMRLQEHKDSIKQVASLSLEDFWCRFLVVEDIWIPLGESLVIAKYSPLWNKMLDGFGNHDPGAGRYKGLRPKWDALHPGRSWAERCEARSETAAQIQAELQAHLRLSNLPPIPTSSIGKHG